MVDIASHHWPPLCSVIWRYCRFPEPSKATEEDWVVFNPINSRLLEYTAKKDYRGVFLVQTGQRCDSDTCLLLISRGCSELIVGSLCSHSRSGSEDLVCADLHSLHMTYTSGEKYYIQRTGPITLPPLSLGPEDLVSEKQLIRSKNGGTFLWQWEEVDGHWSPYDHSV